jgi:hypothetical protein
LFTFLNSDTKAVSQYLLANTHFFPPPANTFLPLDGGGEEGVKGNCSGKLSLRNYTNGASPAKKA